MRLLLDTNAILAILGDVAPLHARVESQLNDSGNEKLVSVVSFWEATIKISKGQLRMAQTPDAVLENFARRGLATILPVQARHLAALRTLPPHHKDPFDRMIVAQALSEDCAVVSSDDRLDAYGISRLW